MKSDLGDPEGTGSDVLSVAQQARVAVMVVAAGNRGGRARYRARCTRGGRDVALERQCTACGPIAVRNDWCLVGQGRREGVGDLCCELSFGARSLSAKYTLWTTLRVLLLTRMKVIYSPTPTATRVGLRIL